MKKQQKKRLNWLINYQNCIEDTYYPKHVYISNNSLFL